MDLASKSNRFASSSALNGSSQAQAVPFSRARIFREMMEKKRRRDQESQTAQAAPPETKVQTQHHAPARKVPGELDTNSTENETTDIGGGSVIELPSSRWFIEAIRSAKNVIKLTFTICRIPFFGLRLVGGFLFGTTIGNRIMYYICKALTPLALFKRFDCGKCEFFSSPSTPILDLNENNIQNQAPWTVFYHRDSMRQRFESLAIPDLNVPLLLDIIDTYSVSGAAKTGGSGTGSSSGSNSRSFQKIGRSFDEQALRHGLQEARNHLDAHIRALHEKASSLGMLRTSILRQPLKEVSILVATVAPLLRYIIYLPHPRDEGQRRIEGIRSLISTAVKERNDLELILKSLKEGPAGLKFFNNVVCNNEILAQQEVKELTASILGARDKVLKLIQDRKRIGEQRAGDDTDYNKEVSIWLNQHEALQSKWDQRQRDLTKLTIECMAITEFFNQCDNLIAWMENDEAEVEAASRSLDREAASVAGWKYTSREDGLRHVNSLLVELISDYLNSLLTCPRNLRSDK